MSKLLISLGLVTVAVCDSPTTPGHRFMAADEVCTVSQDLNKKYRLVADETACTRKVKQCFILPAGHTFQKLELASNKSFAGPDDKHQIEVCATFTADISTTKCVLLKKPESNEELEAFVSLSEGDHEVQVYPVLLKNHFDLNLPELYGGESCVDLGPKLTSHSRNLAEINTGLENTKVELVDIYAVGESGTGTVLNNCLTYDRVKRCTQSRLDATLKVELNVYGQGPNDMQDPIRMNLTLAHNATSINLPVKRCMSC